MGQLRGYQIRKTATILVVMDAPATTEQPKATLRNLFPELTAEELERVEETFYSTATWMFCGGFTNG
jgi:hypothetical protein